MLQKFLSYGKRKNYATSGVLVTFECVAGNASENRFYVKCEEDSEKIVLKLCNQKFKLEKSPYNDKESYFTVIEDFENEKSIVYDKKTDTIENLELASEIQKQIPNSVCTDWKFHVPQFIYSVVKYRNPVVFDLLHTYSAASQRFQKQYLKYDKHSEILFSFLKNLDKINILEKVRKSQGDDFAFNLILNCFEGVEESKKLSNVIGLPMFVANGIKKLGIEQAYNNFLSIAEKDVNDTVVLMSYLLNLRKILLAEYCKKEYIYSFVSSINSLLKTGVYKNMSILLKYLIAENFNFGEYNVPHKEAKELYDYISIVMDIDDEFEKYPRNIQKFLNIAQINSQVIKKPRPVEFEKATRAYSYVNDYGNDDFAFFAPRSEKELYEEGQILHHCVASWRDRIVDKGAKVVLMRKKEAIDTPFVTIEYENGVVTQVKEKYNEDVTDKEVLTAISYWLGRTNRRAKEMGMK